MIYREFDDLGARTYHPVRDDGEISWVTKLRNNNLALSPEELQLLKRFDRSIPVPISGDSCSWRSSVGFRLARSSRSSYDPSCRICARGGRGNLPQHAIFRESTIAALAASPRGSLRQGTPGCPPCFRRQRQLALCGSLRRASLTGDR